VGYSASSSGNEKVYGGVMNVYDEKTKRRGTKKENSKSTEVFCGELCV